MIIDRIEHCPLYTGLGDGIRLALEHIRTTDFTQSKTGRYDLDGDNLFVIVNDYETVSRQAGQLEGHRQYIDVQYLVRGTEWIGYAPLTGQIIAMDYDAADDCILYEGEATFVKIQAGMFAVFFPHDLHQPGTGQEPNPVRKVVVKVKIS
jgi:YhcH/YjgK/YiaL family protein